MAKLPLLSELTECPHCGSVDYYTRDRAAGHITSRYTFDGSEISNEDMYEGLAIRTSAYVYCGSCNEKIARNNMDKKQ